MTTLSRRKLARRILALLTHTPHREVMRATAHVLQKQRRVGERDLLLRDIAEERLAAQGVVEATVTSARPLSASVKKDITKWLQAYYAASDVKSQYAQDDSLIGGAKIETPRHRFKFSIADRFTSLIAHL